MCLPSSHALCIVAAEHNMHPEALTQVYIRVARCGTSKGLAAPILAALECDYQQPSVCTHHQVFLVLTPGDVLHAQALTHANASL